MSVNQKMSLYMGVTLSAVLSLAGLLSSGRFTLAGYLANFGISLVISLLLGFFIPMHKITSTLTQKAHIQPRTMKARLFGALISDIIYTPIMTFIMVTAAYFQAARHGIRPFYPAMLGKSLVISLIMAYLTIFLVTPIYIKLAAKGKS